ncbi:MAG: hypothetical protein ABL966_02335 [Acidimicrobiales bacterium]
MSRRAGAAAGLALLALVACACTSDADPVATTTSSSTVSTSTTLPGDADLEGRLIAAADLPAGFAPDADVDDTITAFCAGQDAAAGLQASARSIVGFTRTPPGASVIQLAFRFDDDGAALFVEQAEALLTSCSDVPDATGLAFTYEAVTAPVAAALDGVEASASRYGVSVGSGTLTLDVAVLQQGDLGTLVAVLGLDQPRDALDELAVAAFTAAVERLQE